MNPKKLKKDSWYWNKWIFGECNYGRIDVIEGLETGGLLQYVGSNSPSNYRFHTVTGDEYCLPPRCVEDDLEPISSAAALKFFMLFVTKRKKSREYET